jgi:CheY-like chemotaxis protein
MNAPCQALIVEDDPDQLATIVSVVRDVHLEPLPARSPDQALNKLIYHQPVLAILDLDVAGEGEARGSIDDVLLRLYQYFGGCFVIVYSERAEELHQRRKVHAIHPLAMFVSKQDGDKALSDRIHGMMSGRVGDLVVRQGVTYHEPSGRTHQHRVGVSLILGATLDQEVVLDDTDAKAARRMDAWLRRVGSQVRVVDQGRRCYALYVTEGRERVAPEPQAHEASA